MNAGSSRLLTLVVLVLCMLLAGVMVWTLLGLPEAAVRLPAQVLAELPHSGVEHPVTAVLLNFRGYDTLLEVAVLLLALLGMLAAGVAPQQVGPASATPMLAALARALVPLMVLAAGYVLWAGAFRPGGAFQAGALLAAAGVLLRLAGYLPAWTAPGVWLRIGLAAGFAAFLAVAALGLVEGELLHYPEDWAGGLILAIESALTFSLGLTLAGLFLAGPELPRWRSGHSSEGGG